MHSPEDEAELVRAAAHGDRVAFGALYARYRPLVAMRVSYLVGIRGSTDDAVQETFLRAYKALPAFRGECPFEWWLLRIATRVARSERRSLRRSIWRLFVGDAEEETTAQHAPAVAEHYAELALVHEALDHLSPRLREAVIWFELQGLTLKEIADEQGMPLNTVAARVRRGREAMREHVAKRVGDRALNPVLLACRGEAP